MEPQDMKNGAGPKEEASPRRSFLGWMVGLINGGIALAIIGPTLGFLAAPLRQKKAPGVWIPVLEESALADGEMKSVTYEIEVTDGYMQARRKYSIFVNRKGRKVSAYDPSCPHLGCHVEYKDPKKRFVCPCHGGVFDEEGNRVSGPPPRGLSRIAAKTEGGRIWIHRG